MKLDKHLRETVHLHTKTEKLHIIVYEREYNNIVNSVISSCRNLKR